MREVITIHLGGAGVAMGATMWELFCLEHGISDTGETWLIGDNVTSMFSPGSESKQPKPRAIFIDSEPGGIDIVRENAISGLLGPSQLIDGKEDSGGIYSRARLSICPQLIDIVLEEVRRMTEDCTELEGFFLMNSVSGGTGSALCSHLLERLKVDYSGKMLQTVNLYPDKCQDVSVVEPYNTILSSHSLIEFADVSYIQDNAALARCSSPDSYYNRSHFARLNEVTAQVMSSLTASIRYDGALNVDMHEICTNLVPYPRIHFALQSHAPVLPRARPYYDGILTGEISNAVLKPESCLASCDHSTGKFMACCMQYRGHVIPKDVGAAIGAIKTRRTLQFVDWSPAGFRCGISYQPGAAIDNGEFELPPRSICMFSNSTAVKTVFRSCVNRFDSLFAKKAFLHWFINDGMEEEEISGARENLEMLLKDYDEIEADAPEDEEE